MRPDSGPRLAVFDVDGTLVDSREVIHGAALAAFAALSLAPPPSMTTILVEKTLPLWR